MLFEQFLIFSRSGQKKNIGVGLGRNVNTLASRCDDATDGETGDASGFRPQSDDRQTSGQIFRPQTTARRLLLRHCES